MSSKPTVRPAATGSSDAIDAYWAVPLEALYARLDASLDGLSGEEAITRLRQFGRNTLRPERHPGAAALLRRQFASPILLILVGATVVSIATGEVADGGIILAIIAMSGLLGFAQERSASRAVEALLALIHVEATVLRDHEPRHIPVEEVVPGDVVLLGTGDVVPGDCIAIQSQGLQVNEAALTGESFPVEKEPGLLSAGTPLDERVSVLHLGTHVVSGQGRALVINTGQATEFGHLTRVLEASRVTTFERGITHFGELLVGVMAALVAAVFVVNLALERPLVESLLFSVALAVGVTPQLLPAIVSVSLAAGARAMAHRRVVVRRLNSIEDFGGMSILCTDKTGTMTDGRVRLATAVDIDGAPSEAVLTAARLNASHQSSFTNPIDQAIRDAAGVPLPAATRLDEVAYDFHRRRLSLLLDINGRSRLITKGAVAEILETCAFARLADGSTAPIGKLREAIGERFRSLSGDGLRVLAVSERDMGEVRTVSAADERDLTFLGFIAFDDPPKEDIAQTVAELANLNVSVRMVTGDNRFVAAHVGAAAGLDATRLMLGSDVERLDARALALAVRNTEIFAEVTPTQKECVVRAFARGGQSVGYLGDGINDVPPLRAADIGISVNEAVPVAKEAGDIVLMEKDLRVLAEGVRLGRRTFANTLKYISVTTSANLGNTVSMAGAAAWLPFLPLLPRQVLLLNFLSDLPAMTIAGDAVDSEQLERPQRWDVRAALGFMLTFGLISTVFDVLTFVTLRRAFDAGEELFRSAWFLESTATELCVMLLLRTRRPFFRSRPGTLLLTASVAVAALTGLLPFSPAADALGFSSPGVSVLLALLGLTAGYVVATETAKLLYYSRRRRRAPHIPRRPPRRVLGRRPF